MVDFRSNPDRSPVVWSPVHNKLMPATNAVRVMKTAFYVSPNGIYPYGVFAPASTTKH